jgi:hypothetical protein
MKHLLWIPVLLTGCGTAGSARYSESDNRQTISADLDTTFIVSLPGTMKAESVFSPNVLALVQDRIDDLTGRRHLEFRAKALGETEIRVGTEFSLRVRVTSASDRPGMHVHTR